MDAFESVKGPGVTKVNATLGNDSHVNRVSPRRNAVILLLLLCDFRFSKTGNDFLKETFRFAENSDSIPF